MFKHDIPFDPGKVRFFYGWIIVPAALIGILTSIPGQTAGFSAFKEPICTSLGISGTNLATAYFFGTVTSGLILPKAGRFLDLYGTRKTIFLVYFFFGITLFLFSKCEDILSFLEHNITFINRDILYISCLAVLVLGIRFFGQGMLPIISNTMIGRWFDKKRGKVVAMMGILNSLTFNAAPLVLSFMVGIHGWQDTWLVLAVIMGIGFLIFSWIFYRDSPEECGLHVDGITPENSEEHKKLAMEGMTVEEAVSTANFKVVTAALCLYGMILTGFTFNLESIGKSAGMTQKQAMSLLIPISIISVPVGFTTAWLSDTFSKKYLVLIQLTFQVLAYFSLAFLKFKTGYIFSVLCLGFAGGMFGPIYTIAFAWFFGRKHLGAINGKVTSFMVLTSAVGPLFFETVHDHYGSYTPAFFISAVLPAIVLIYGGKMETGELYKLKKTPTEAE